nr:metallophosphoesterase [Cryobacterium sp. Y50]
MSDPHLDGSPEALSRLTQVADHLRGLAIRPDVVIVSGDLTQSAGSLPPADETVLAAQNLESLLAALSMDVPVFCCPGNTDDRMAFASRFGLSPPIPGPVHQVHRLGQLVIILLDVTVPGHGYGQVTDSILAWLARQLDALSGDERAVLVMHQPPTPLYHAAVDGLFLRSSEALEAIITRHEQIVAVLCGHTHAALTTTFAGKPLVIAPGIRSAGVLLQEIREPGSPLTTDDVPPGYAMHVLQENHFSSQFRTLAQRSR